jgi:hypothetical protein
MATIHVLLTSKIDGGKWSASRPGRFAPGGKTIGYLLLYIGDLHHAASSYNVASNGTVRHKRRIGIDLEGRFRDLLEVLS